jgi:hypothetical protein
MYSLIYIKQLLETICANNLAIQTFGMGSDFDISIPEIKYPQVYAEIQTSAINDKLVTLTFNIVVSDRLERDNSNEIQVLSDTLDIVMDLRAALIGAQNENLKIDLNNSIDPFTESSTDVTAGWVWGVSFDIIDLKDRCNLPTI